MSSRVLTPDVAGIDAPYTITKPFWQKLKAVWLPYLLTMPRRFMPSRLHARLNCWRWKKSWRVREAMSIWTINSIRNRKPLPLLYPWGNSPCIRTGNPMPTLSAAALWGVALREPVTTEELASFIAYWQAEGKVFHHVQWQQNWRAACKSVVPATADCRNEM